MTTRIIIYNQFHLGVWKSELLSYLNYVRRPKYILSFYSVKNYLRNRKTIRQNISYLKKESGLSTKLIILPSLTNPFIITTAVWILSRVLTLIHESDRFELIGFYCVGGYLASRFKSKFNATVIFEMRSIEHIELEELKQGRPKIIIKLKSFLKYSLSVADEITVVSQKMCDYIRSNFIVNGGITVRPLLVSNKKFYFSNSGRSEIRDKLSIRQESIIFTYVGSIAKHQLLDATIELFELLSKNRSDLVLLLITDQVDHLMNKVNRYSFNSFVLSVDNAEIYKYLSASDYGFLLREDLVMNNTASPTKFAEYLSCGLRVITTNYVGDYSQLILDRNIGLIVHHRNSESVDIILNDIRLQRFRDKEITAKFAEKYLSWENYNYQAYMALLGKRV